MRYLPTPQQMAAADEAAIAAGTPPELLMDRAGRAVARAVLDVAGRRYGLRVAVVCGNGNNGGDGFVAARVLQREGASVRVLSVGDVRTARGAAADHLAAWFSEGGSVDAFEVDALERADVVVDAVFGTGFRGRAEGEAGQALEAMSRLDVPVVAVDIPSGVDGGSGRCEGPCVAATMTVAMGAEKIGTAIGEGATRAGTVQVADIGIPVESGIAMMIESDDVARAIPARPADSHKRSSGTVLLFAGSDEMTGAALLTARGALRAGCGYVNLVAPERVRAAAAEAVPELVTQTVSGSTLGPDALEASKDLLAKADAIAIGPGIGRGHSQRGLLERLVHETELPIVADADALNVAAEDPSMLEERHAPLTITPHPAELARLLGTSTSDVQDERLGAVTEAARRFGCVVLLKGHRSLIADAGGRVVVNPTGGPELATAGTGDVLTGACAAYLAAGLDPFTATWASAYVHGVAGTLAAAARGSSGVVAGDVAEALGEAADLVVEGSWF
ncbi:MAG: NAD(P)H-hydrate dehydratase [Actinobacteria bacterium]|nr:NAD(P)H-hydrate dehydratase [Actinomycetota bacterium]